MAQKKKGNGNNRNYDNNRGGRRRGGGRGGRRQLIPTSIGFVYPLQSNVDDFDDDFRIYGQFSSDEDTTTANDDAKGPMLSKNKKRNSKSGRRANKGSRMEFEGNHTLQLDDVFYHDSAPSSSTATAAAPLSNNLRRSFRKGKSSVQLSKQAFDNLKFNLSEDWNQSTDAAITEGSTSTVKAPAERMDMFDYEALTTKHGPSTKTLKGREKKGKCIISQTPIVDFTSDSDDDDVDNLSYSSDDMVINDDRLLDEDIDVMCDYMENIELDEDEILEYFSRFETQGDLNNYELPDSWERLQEFGSSSYSKEFPINISSDEDEEDTSDEERHILRQEALRQKKGRQGKENKRAKGGVRQENKDLRNVVVDPEIFGQTLQQALAEVPPSLRGSMQRWCKKHQNDLSNRGKRKKEAHSKQQERDKGSGKKGKGKGLQSFSGANLDQIDKRIRQFISDDSISSYQFAPMSPFLRKQVHVFAEAYNLKSYSEGKGESRFTIISKRKDTAIPADDRPIKAYISNMQKNVDELQRLDVKKQQKQQQSRTMSKKQNKRVASSQREMSRQEQGGSRANDSPKSSYNSSAATKLKPGTVVAANAAPIGEDNIGHRLLASMGWKHGESLGVKRGGIVAPVEVVIRRKNQGLGFN